jgi:aquaporin related protein
MGEERMHGMPREYGAGRRPYSESIAPPHPNDRFTGLADRGMYGDEIVKPTHSVGGDSDRALASAVGGPSSQGTAVRKSAINPGSRGSNAHGNENGRRGEVSEEQHLYIVSLQT